ncbi:MAG: hypothetical protein PUD63_05700 [Clostridia bacterium]|nr:hypothetical protein [Clostridia bacterium]
MTDARLSQLAHFGFFQAFFCMLAFGSEDPAVAALLRNRLFGITQHSRGRRKVRRLQ